MEQHHSTLELVKHDETTKAPELDHDDHDATVFELEVSALAPQDLVSADYCKITLLLPKIYAVMTKYSRRALVHRLLTKYLLCSSQLRFSGDFHPVKAPSGRPATA